MNESLGEAILTPERIRRAVVEQDFETVNRAIREKKACIAGVIGRSKILLDESDMGGDTVIDIDVFDHRGMQTWLAPMARGHGRGYHHRSGDRISPCNGALLDDNGDEA